MTEILPNETVVSLTTLNQGAAIDLFDVELRKVLADIADPNASARTKREITLKVVFAPDEDRGMAMVGIDCKSKIAGRRGSATRIFFGVMDGQPVAVEAIPNQGRLFDQQLGKLKTVPMRTKEGGNVD